MSVCLSVGTPRQLSIRQTDRRAPDRQTKPTGDKEMKIPTLSLRSAATWLENTANTILGPALAISGIIAGVDLVTGGTILEQQGWLSMTWAICLLLALDFQVLMLGV